MWCPDSTGGVLPWCSGAFLRAGFPRHLVSGTASHAVSVSSGFKCCLSLRRQSSFMTKISGICSFTLISLVFGLEVVTFVL